MPKWEKEKENGKKQKSCCDLLLKLQNGLYAICKKYFFDGEQYKETAKNGQIFLKNEKTVLKYEKVLEIKGFGGKSSAQLQREFSNMRIRKRRFSVNVRELIGKSGKMSKNRAGTKIA